MTSIVGSLKRSDEEEESRSELDSHADTCVLGSNALIIHEFGKKVRVHGYDALQGAKTYRLVSGVVAYDDPSDGVVKMLVIHQAIHVPHLVHNLLSSMQLRDNDLKVNDEPKHLMSCPMEDHNAIVFPETAEREELRIPLTFHNVTSCFPTRKPSRAEWDACDDVQIFELTYESPEWLSQAERFKEQEEAMLTSAGLLKDITAQMVDRNIFALHTFLQQ